MKRKRRTRNLGAGVNGKTPARRATTRSGGGSNKAATGGARRVPADTIKVTQEKLQEKLRAEKYELFERYRFGGPPPPVREIVPLTPTPQRMVPPPSVDLEMGGEEGGAPLDTMGQWRTEQLETGWRFQRVKDD